MKTIFTMMLLFITTSSCVIAQTIKQYPINGDKIYHLYDMAVYEDKVAVAGIDFSDNKVQVNVFDNNQWTSLPMTVYLDGNEEYILNRKPSRLMYPQIRFDNQGSIWLLGIDGLYNFVENKWVKHSIKNVDQKYTSYFHFTIDQQGSIWVLASVAITTGDSAKSGRRLYRFQNGEFSQYIEQYSYFPDDFPIPNVSSLDNKDIKNTGTLSDGVVLFGDRRYLVRELSDNPPDLVFVKSDGTANFLPIPMIDKPDQKVSIKKLNRIYVDSKNRVFFLMKYQEGYNPNTQVVTQCCSGIARLDNGTDWYTYTKDNNTPYSENFHDNYIRYANPEDMCELKNNEYLFIMRNNGTGEPRNLQLYKLNSENKFDTLQWKSYVENATVYRSDYFGITEEALKSEIDILKNGSPMESKLKISGMKTDMYGNVWIFGNNYVLKMTDDPTTSVAETFKKPTVIYPNPGNKSIRLSNSLESIVQIDIVSLLGENVLSIQKDFESINVSSLPIGFYMVKIKRIDGSVEYVKYNKN